MGYDISPDWTVFGGAGARWATFNALTGSARVTSANGDLTETVLNFPGWTNTNTQQIGLRGRADTGPFRHAVAFSGTRLVNEGGQLFPPVVATVSNLYQPTFVTKPNVAALNPPKTAATELSSLALHLRAPGRQTGLHPLQRRECPRSQLLASANSSFGLAMGGPRTFFLSLTADF